MKLTQKLNSQYVSYSLAIFIIVGIALFIVLKNIVNEDTDEKLENTFEQIELLISEKPQSLNLYPTINVNQGLEKPFNKYFSDTTLLVNDELEEYRQLIGSVTIENVHYKIIVRELGIESSDLLSTLAVVILIGFLFLILSLYVINKRITQTTWLPFYYNLEKLKQFSLQSSKPFIPTKTDTEEFNEMNIVLKSLTDKVISDYDNLKKFSENASHELQTPLAIIRTKIEAILDENTLSSTQVEKMQSIYQNINRLSKINKGLILLTKIENKQFTGQEEISLNDIIKNQIENFSELIEMKHLVFDYHFQSDWKIKGDKILVEMLVNNLFANSILHNIENGQLIIELDNYLLKFSNSGERIISENEKLFERFYKSGATGSTGLGLAISKQICLSMGLNISYTFENQLHIFKISF
nr:HAMP domain-containing sensor histidine kinase [uncultured Carboxylicivirga sp.]